MELTHQLWCSREIIYITPSVLCPPPPPSLLLTRVTFNYEILLLSRQPASHPSPSQITLLTIRSLPAPGAVAQCSYSNLLLSTLVLTLVLTLLPSSSDTFYRLSNSVAVKYYFASRERR